VAQLAVYREDWCSRIKRQDWNRAL